MEELTPREIVAELDKYIIGQHQAKRAVAVALRSRYRRSRLAPEMRNDIIPKNILMIGPTGVGKTEIARRLALLARAPFVKVEATKFTEVGYVGRNVNSMIRDLLHEAIRLVDKEKMEDVRSKAEERAVERVVDVLQPRRKARTAEKPGSNGQNDFMDAFSQMLGRPPASSVRTAPPPAPEPTDEDHKREEQENRVRNLLHKQVASGVKDGDSIEIEVEESQSPPVMQVFSQPGMEEGGGDMQSMLSSFMPKRLRRKTVTIAEAREYFAGEEARSLVDQDQVVREAIERAEQSGIIFIDEMDKIAGSRGNVAGPDVSREGVQRDILPIIEGSTVQTKQGAVKTDHMLFIAAGAFHVSKPSDLIPELQGRLPIRVELESLSEDDLKRILTEPRNALVTQYKAMLETEGITLEFTDGGVAELASIAAQVNSQMENIGARRLHTVMERLLEEMPYEAPDLEEKHVVVDAAFVKERLSGIVKDEDLSRYIL